MQHFSITRVYADAHGDSRFEDREIPLHEAGLIGALSEGFTVRELIFRKVKPDYDYHFHNAPERQFLVLLNGEIEIETSLGEKRIFKAGDVLQLEDTEGKGHRTRNILQEERNSLFIPYD